MWPVQFVFLSTPFWLLVVLLHFSHDWSNWSSPSFSSTTFEKNSSYFWSTFRSVQFQHHTKLCSKCSTLLVLLLLLLLQSELQPLVGFWPAQLSLSILSRKVLQSAVASGTSNPPSWRRTRDLERYNFRHKRPRASEATLANPAAEGRTMGEKWPRNFAESGDFHVTLGFFYMP
jgi:hypothetical protein